MTVIGTLVGVTLSLGGADATATRAQDWQSVGARILARKAAVYTPGHNACAGRPLGVNVTDLPADIGGQAHLAECVMDVNDDLWPQERCAVYVHEGLHLMRGDGWHDPTPGRPLSATLFIPRRCERVTK